MEGNGDDIYKAWYAKLSIIDDASEDIEISSDGRKFIFQLRTRMNFSIKVISETCMKMSFMRNDK